jgi:hypothetical protein
MRTAGLVSPLLRCLLLLVVVVAVGGVAVVVVVVVVCDVTCLSQNGVWFVPFVRPHTKQQQPQQRNPGTAGSFAKRLEFPRGVASKFGNNKHSNNVRHLLFFGWRFFPHRQPSHAAMARWSYDGWQPCLGGGLHKSWWENQTGNDFVLETKARNAVDSEIAYATKVDRLHWVAACYNEKKKDDNPDPNAPWLTLSTMQRQRLAKTRDKVQPRFPEQLFDAAVPNKVRALIQIPAAAESITVDPTTGTIVIPVGTCKESKQSVCMRRYDAGGKRQVWLKDNGSLLYDIQAALVTSFAAVAAAAAASSSSSCAAVTAAAATTTTTAYSLTLIVCTVHKQDEKLLVKCPTNGDSVINVPYTMGYWQETSPVVVQYDSSGSGNGNGSSWLYLERVKQYFGVSIQELRLVPHQRA